MKINKSYLSYSFGIHVRSYVVSVLQPGNYYSGHSYKNLKTVYIESICVLYEKE